MSSGQNKGAPHSAGVRAKHKKKPRRLTRLSGALRATPQAVVTRTNLRLFGPRVMNSTLPSVVAKSV